MKKLPDFVWAGLLLGAITSVAPPVLAKDWVIDYGQSRLGFIGMQGSEAFEGSFKSFQAKIDLDPDRPETGAIEATIEIASATAGSAERDSYLPQADWFDARKFPAARFASTHIRKTGAETYMADGQLTIKGLSRPVSLPFTLKQAGDHWLAEGKLDLLRTDFHIGEGAWSNEAYVKRAVTVVIKLTAKPSLEGSPTNHP